MRLLHLRLAPFAAWCTIQTRLLIRTSRHIPAGTMFASPAAWAVAVDRWVVAALRGRARQLVSALLIAATLAGSMLLTAFFTVQIGASALPGSLCGSYARLGGGSLPPDWACESAVSLNLLSPTLAHLPGQAHSNGCCLLTVDVQRFESVCVPGRESREAVIGLRNVMVVDWTSAVNADSFGNARCASCLSKRQHNLLVAAAGPTALPTCHAVKAATGHACAHRPCASKPPTCGDCLTAATAAAAAAPLAVAAVAAMKRAAAGDGAALGGRWGED